MEFPACGSGTLTGRTILTRLPTRTVGLLSTPCWLGEPTSITAGGSGTITPIFTTRSVTLATFIDRGRFVLGPLSAKAKAL